jgi:serine protease Do
MLGRFTLVLILVCACAGHSYATDFSRLFDKASDATVVIHTKASLSRLTEQGIKTDSAKGLGSGVLISKQGDILTAAHVVSMADDIVVQLHNGESYPARVVSLVGYADIAMLRLVDVPDKLHTVHLGDSGAMRTGEEVFVIGAPYGLEYTLTAGHFSGLRKNTSEITGETLEFLQTDAPINRGNSGGPLFNSTGQLVGIVSHIQTQSGGNQGLGFAASIDMIKSLLIERPPIWIGADVLPLKGEYAKALNLAEDEGFLVQHVTGNSWAEQAGLLGGTIEVNLGGHAVLLGGDIIQSIGGSHVYSTIAGMKRIRAYMQQVPAGQDIEMTVLRGGETLAIKAPKPVF